MTRRSKTAAKHRPKRAPGSSLRLQFRGRAFSNPAEVFNSAKPPAAVPYSTFSSRLERALSKGPVLELRLLDILYLPVSGYRRKYGARISWLDVGKARLSLGEYFEEHRGPNSPSYPNFRQRLRGLEKRIQVDPEAVEDAISLSSQDWRVLYGGGRSRAFKYEGEVHPELSGESFRSIAAFLLRIGKYQLRKTIWSRLKAKWDLDAALIDPVVGRSERLGRVYKITSLKTGEVYVGLTRLSLMARWAQHIAASRAGATTRLACAVRRDGHKAFRCQTLEEGIKENSDLKARETYWVGRLKARGEKGLNSAFPGALGLRQGKPISYGKENFPSFAEAGAVLGKRHGLPSHVVERRLRTQQLLPKRARRKSGHAEAGSNLFRRWLALNRRHPEDVSLRWKGSLDKFKSDVVPSQRDGFHLVRMNSLRKWGPRNFKWASVAEKMGKTHGRSVVYQGRRYPTLKSLGTKFGIGVSTLKFRLGKGMSIRKAITTPLGRTSYRAASEKWKVGNRRFRSKRQASLFLATTKGLTEGQARYRLEKALHDSKVSGAKRRSV